MDQTPIDSAVQPEQPQDQTPSGEILQAPPLADGAQQQAQAPEPQQPEAVPAEQFVSRAEFEQIMQELQTAKADQGVLAQIKELSEQQQYQQRTRQEVSSLYEQLAEASDTDTAIEQLTRYITGRDQALTGTFQQQVNDYHAQVENYLWEANKPALADNYVREYGLPPSVKEQLLALPDDQTMKLVAQQAQRTYADAQQMFGQNAAANQVGRMKQSGVLAMGGEGGSPPPQEIKPGTTQELMPALRTIFGLSN